MGHLEGLSALYRGGRKVCCPVQCTGNSWHWLWGKDWTTESHSKTSVVVRKPPSDKSYPLLTRFVISLYKMLWFLILFLESLLPVPVLDNVLENVLENVHTPPRVTCQMSGVFFLQNGWASWWRVCYQRGLPRLVYWPNHKTVLRKIQLHQVCYIYSILNHNM